MEREDENVRVHVNGNDKVMFVALAENEHTRTDTTRRSQRTAETNI
jgi:hypothetical protein